ncbi:uncharacterized protein ACA1_062880 [Acanthamoeba castellanii str. Neff]|uniref:DUF974 domain containing protein n=1 Tax=Acanthamoeba castellanii (strain ATCC 30010 / Neff) TaxID=1257118 RepID=L8GWE1_ACACF|nr:uncharacterized protein ACA1_062880 [Acanthamoeba castellanii str. Neff]ELR17534.1 hypothetical protein ACA1_062880 [Acanthamoeba castellanii str. Neff]
MRLSKPTLQFQPPVLVEADDAPYPLSKTGEDQPTMTSSNVQNAFSLSPGLNLPRAFGNIYVGETFCSYISLYNHTQSDLHLVGLRAELNTKVLKNLLIDQTTAGSIQRLAAGERHDFIVRYRVVEPTMHILVCTISYAKGGEKKSFRKFFKFTVVDSFEWKQRIFHIKDDTLLEVQLRNVARNAVFLNNVKYGPAFNPGTARSYLFQLRPRRGAADATMYTKRLRNRVSDADSAGANEDDEETDSSTSDEMQIELARIKLEADEMVLGKLLLSWHTSFGETGTRKILVKHKPSPSPEVEISITSIASAITLETPFPATVTVTNKLPRPILPWVQLAQDHTANVVAAGLSAGFKLEEIPSGGSKSAEVAFLPLQAGIQTITGISVLDKKTGRVYACPDHEILVLQPPIP